MPVCLLHYATVNWAAILSLGLSQSVVVLAVQASLCHDRIELLSVSSRPLCSTSCPNTQVEFMLFSDLFLYGKPVKVKKTGSFVAVFAYFQKNISIPPPIPPLPILFPHASPDTMQARPTILCTSRARAVSSRSRTWPTRLSATACCWLSLSSRTQMPVPPPCRFSAAPHRCQYLPAGR